MADQSPDAWLPAGWTVRVHVRRNGKKDKHYFSPSGQKFYSKVEVMRYTKTVKQSPPQQKKEKGAIFGDAAKDAPSDAVQEDVPDSQEKGKSGLEPSLQNGSPESEEKYYSAEDAGDEGCGSLNSEDNKNAKPDQPAAHCSHLKSGEDKPPVVVAEEFAENGSGSSAEGEKSNLEQSIENCNPPLSKEVKSVNAEESADKICGSALENGSHRSKDEEDVILGKNKNDACDPVGERGSPGSKQKKKTPAKKYVKAGVERGVAEGLPDGWIKEVKVTKKKRGVRKDSFYIDPSSGYIFRSLRDALRYLATGDIGRLAFKRKDEGDGDTALEDDKISSPVETKRQKLDEKGTRLVYRRSKATKQHNLDEKQTTTMNGNSVRGAEVTRERVVEPPDTGEAVPDTGVSVTDFSVSDVPKPSGSGKNEERNNAHETDPTPVKEDGFSRDEHPSGKREEMPVLSDKTVVLGDELPMEDIQEPASAEVAESPRVEQPEENTENTFAAADETGVARAKQLLEKTEVTTAPADEAEVPQDEQPSQKTEETPGDKTTPQATPKSRKRKVLDFPRRTSTRLSGVAIDPGLEVRTTTRAQRGTVRNLDEGEVSGAKSVPARDGSQIQPQTKRTRRVSKSSEPRASVAPSEAAPEEDAEKLERIQVDDEKEDKGTTAMPQENILVPNNAEKLKADDKSEEKPVLQFDLPSEDILSDPCIEFAIKTLTGMDFDASQSNSKSSNDNNSSRDAASLKMQAEHMEIERKVDKKQAPPEKNISKANNSEEKAGAENPSSSLSNLPFGDSWQDPCIEFAIGTLTGAIPVEYDLDINDLMRQQIRSTEIQESSEVALSNAGLDNFCRTDLLWQHSTGPSSDKAACRQQSGAVPITQQPSGNNADLQRTGGAVPRQPRQKTQNRGNKYQR